MTRGVSAADVLARYDAIGAEVRAEAASLAGGRRLESAAEVMAPFAPRTSTHTPPNPSSGHSVRLGSRAENPSCHQGSGVQQRTLAESINATLAELLDADRRVLVFGEDVGAKGGVYGVTRGLQRRFGSARVFDTILDEQSILGLGLGAGLAGLIPIPEIQYLAYLHNAEDQLRGEAASLRFFSNGAYAQPDGRADRRTRVPERIRRSLPQRQRSGHAARHPRSGVACPSRGDDAAAMLRACVAAAATDGTVSVFLEPIALYHTRDLHVPGDNGWLAVDPAGDASIGRARHYPADDADPSSRAGLARLTMITFGNGVPMSLRVADASPSRASAPTCWICDGWPRCPSRTSWTRRAGPGACSSSTRPGTAAGSARA